MKGWPAHLAALALTALGLLAATFFIGRVVPIDPVLAAIGERAPPEAYRTMREAFGLDRPVFEQFLRYLWQVLRLDFGDSILTARPVARDLLRVFPATFELATVAMLLGIGFGLPLGVAAAFWHGRWPDALARGVALLGYSVPVFWLGLMGLLVFYAGLGWTGGPGRLAIWLEDDLPRVTGLMTVDAVLAGHWAALASALGHLVLPASVLGLFSAAAIARMTRAALIEQLAQDHVTAARARGIPEWRVVLRHGLRPAAAPLVNTVALSYGHLLEGSVLTEIVFAWPGLGLYLTQALLSADMNAVLGATLLVGVLFIGLNALSDHLVRRLDARSR
ncbi:MAG: ABC transporter permease [Alphaproteobacteria bacterium]|nr:ABC transporter permease [Alphaproteobacteria bacterium]